MESQFLGHEVVRQMCEMWSSFRPTPWGDWGWLLRKGLDIGVRALRALMKTYKSSQGETMPESAKRVVKMARRYFEEPSVRSLRPTCGQDDEETRLRKSTLCTLALTMSNLEHVALATMGSPEKYFSQA